MLRSIFLNAIRDQRRALIGWGIGFVAIAAYTVLLYPTVRDSAVDWGEFLDEVPPALKALVGADRVDFGTGVGYLNSQVFTFMIPLLFIVFCVRLGARATAGEEQSGTMDLLLSVPVSRVKVVAEKFAAMSMMTGCMAAVLWSAFAVGTTAADMGVPFGGLAGAVLAAALLGLLFGSVALAAGALTGRRGVAVGVASALAVGTYLMNAIAVIAPRIEGIRLASPWHYYSGSDPLRGGLDPGHAILLSLLTLILFGLALSAFQRRDISV